MRIAALASCAFILAFPGTARAAREIEIFLAGTQSDAHGKPVVTLRFLNAGDREEMIILPERIEARIDQGNGEHTILLARSADTGGQILVGPHGFAQAAYRLPEDVTLLADAMLSIPAWSTQTVRLSPASPTRLAQRGEYPRVRQTAGREDTEQRASPAGEPAPAAPPADRSAGNAFVGNLLPYEPTYAVYGPGTDSDARIQISFQYRFFGSRAAQGIPASWRNGLRFAYTQRMFWDLGAQSSPFRNIDFQPELIYVAPSAMLNNGISLSAQAGIRHESNGRDGPQSRSINSLYIAPMVALPLAGDYSLTLAPRYSIYIGDKSDNPDIARYRGHAGLFMEAGQVDGLRLSTSTRFNFGSGKGAIDANLSYPLPRLLGGGPDAYLFVQSFHGYGENLLDYNRRTTRLRLGLALIR